MNVKTDPLMELMAKLLFGIESDNIPMKARNMMKTRAIKAAYKYHTEAIEALQEENERLREFAESVVQWSKAYPKKIFTEPTPEQIDEVCKESGFRIDRIAGMVLRDFTKPWGIRAQKVLDGE